MFKRFCHNASGATAIEYGLIAALIAAAIVASVASVGSSTNGMWGRVGTEVNTHLP